VRLRHPLEILLELEREALELERLRLVLGGREPILRARANVLEELVALALDAVLVRAEAFLPLLAEEDLEVRGRVETPLKSSVVSSTKRYA